MNSFFEKITKGKPLPLLLTKAMAFALLVFIADSAVGMAFRYLYNRQKSGWESWTKEAVEDAKADIVIVGSSRAQHSYHPKVFEKAFNMSCYDAGRDGQSIFYHYPVLMAMLKRYHPKMIILDCENDMFSINDYSWDRISCLLPFYYSHPEMREVLEKRSSFEKIKLLSKTYPYNSLFFKILLGNIKERNLEEGEVSGYIPLHNELNEPLRVSDYTGQYPIDQYKLHLFQAIVDSCKNAGIKMYVVCSPYYSTFLGKESSIESCKEATQKNGLHYFDFSQDSFFLNKPQLFDDTIHVNYKGSLLFSKMVCDKILSGQ